MEVEKEAEIEVVHEVEVQGAVDGEALMEVEVEVEVEVETEIKVVLEVDVQGAVERRDSLREDNDARDELQSPLHSPQGPPVDWGESITFFNQSHDDDVLHEGKTNNWFSYQHVTLLCIIFLDLLCLFSHAFFRTSLCALRTYIESRFCNPHVVILLK
jgi:hypothetical protein